MALAADADIRRSPSEQSNSSVIVGQQVIIKLFRRIHAGPHPEAEMASYLTEPASGTSRRCSARFGRVAPDGEAFTLGIAQGFIFNQGDAWAWTQNMLDRAIQSVIVLPEDVALDDQLEPIKEFHAAATILGDRLAQMHRGAGAAEPRTRRSPPAPRRRRTARPGPTPRVRSCGMRCRYSTARANGRNEEQGLRDYVLAQRAWGCWRCRPHSPQRESIR